MTTDVVNAMQYARILGVTPQYHFFPAELYFVRRIGLHIRREGNGVPHVGQVSLTISEFLGAEGLAVTGGQGGGRFVETRDDVALVMGRGLLLRGGGGL